MLGPAKVFTLPTNSWPFLHYFIYTFFFLRHPGNPQYNPYNPIHMYVHIFIQLFFIYIFIYVCRLGWHIYSHLFLMSPHSKVAAFSPGFKMIAYDVGGCKLKGQGDNPGRGLRFSPTKCCPFRRHCLYLVH